MKTTLLLTTLALALAPLAFPLQAHEAAATKTAPSSQAEAPKKGGPGGGRIVTSTDPGFEFLVRPDRTIVVTFLNAQRQPIALQKQSVTAIGGERSNPTRFTFSKKGETLVSDQPLPEGNRVPIIVSVKTDAKAKTVTEKFTVDLAVCPSCQYQEYACICDH